MPPKAAQAPAGQTPYEINARADQLDWGGKRPMSKKRQEEWLRRSKTWDGLDPLIWKAKKVLGVGGNGVVGLWEYQGTDPNMPKHIVIKQGKDDDDMGWESRLLKILAGTGSDHFVKLYKATHHVGGTGTLLYFDRIPFNRHKKYDRREEVNRLYLEYCEKGDLSKYKSKFEDLRKIGVYPPEEHMWSIFACLARALLVLETGTEDPDTPDPNFIYSIAHFDIKPANVFVGDRDATEHSWFNIFKLADFGLALPVPEDKYKKGISWILASQWRATEEQRYPKHPHRLIDQRTNVWLVGAVMHGLLSGDHVKHLKFDHTLTHPTTSAETTLTVQGNVLLQPTGTNPDGSSKYLPYSRILIDTILYCLAFDPSERLSATDFVRRTQETLAIYSQMALSGPPLAIYPFEAFVQPNIQPANQPLLGKDPPPNPLPNLQIAGVPGSFQSTGAGPQGPSPANPRLLFPPEAGRPLMVELKDYPHLAIPASPVVP